MSKIIEHKGCQQLEEQRRFNQRYAFGFREEKGEGWTCRLGPEEERRPVAVAVWFQRQWHRTFLQCDIQRKSCDWWRSCNGGRGSVRGEPGRCSAMAGRGSVGFGHPVGVEPLAQQVVKLTVLEDEAGEGMHGGESPQCELICRGVPVGQRIPVGCPHCHTRHR